MRTNTCRLVAVAALCVAAPPVRAMADGLTVGLRLGASVPMGSTLENASTGASAKLSDELRFAFPAWIEAGYRFERHLTAGLYFQYARAALSERAPLGQSSCSAGGAGCSGASATRLGAELLYGTSPGERWEPWFGVGTGYEWLGYDFRDSTGSGSISYRGWEWVNLQAGLDFVASSDAAFGPWVAVCVGEYSTARLESGGQSIDGDISRKAVHGWLQLGFRARFDL